jgi:DNA-binding MarR family transcriptional regulator
MMQTTTSLDLTRELFQLMKRFPRPKLPQSSRHELTRSESELLAVLVMILADGKQAPTVTEISSLLQITPAGVTHLLNPLEAAGFIERQPHPTDRRVVLIGLTAKGTEIGEGLIAEIQEKLIGLINHLGEEDSRTLIRLLSRSIEYFASQFEF